MSLLTACQDVADVIGLTRPTAIASGTDQLARQMFAIAKDVLAELGLMDWPFLQIPYSFDTVVDQASYSMPADFGREVGDTVFLASQYYQLRGSLTPGDWQRQRNSLAVQNGRYKFRLFGLPLKLYITPTPSAAEEIVLEYQTTYRVQQADTTYKTTFFADDDEALVPEDLLKMGIRWRLKRAKGLDYSEDFNEYEIARANRLAQQLSLGSIAVAYRNQAEVPELADGYVPEFGYGS